MVRNTWDGQQWPPRFFAQQISGYVLHQCLQRERILHNEAIL